jgi:hypothetical protein
MRKRFSKAQLLHFTANLEVELSSLVGGIGTSYIVSSDRGLLRQLEGVESCRRRSEVAELVGVHLRGLKRERGKPCSRSFSSRPC